IKGVKLAVCQNKIDIASNGRGAIVRGHSVHVHVENHSVCFSCLSAVVKPLGAAGCSRRLLTSALQMLQITAKSRGPQLSNFIARPATRAEDCLHRPWVFDQ